MDVKWEWYESDGWWVKSSRNGCLNDKEQRKWWIEDKNWESVSKGTEMGEIIWYHTPCCLLFSQ